MASAEHLRCRAGFGEKPIAAVRRIGGAIREVTVLGSEIARQWITVQVELAAALVARAADGRGFCQGARREIGCVKFGFDHMVAGRIGRGGAGCFGKCRDHFNPC